MSIRWKLILGSLSFMAIIVAVYIATSMVTSNQKADGRVINLAGRQRALYIGRSQDLADRLRRLLDQFQRAHRERRLLKRLQTHARASLRRVKAQLKELLARRGIQMKGFEFRGVRRALPLPPIRPAPSAAAPGKIPPYG